MPCRRSRQEWRLSARLTMPAEWRLPCGPAGPLPDAARVDVDECRAGIAAVPPLKPGQPAVAKILSPAAATDEHPPHCSIRPMTRWRNLSPGFSPCAGTAKERNAAASRAVRNFPKSPWKRPGWPLDHIQGPHLRQLSYCGSAGVVSARFLIFFTCRSASALPGSSSSIFSHCSRASLYSPLRW